MHRVQDRFHTLHEVCNLTRTSLRCGIHVEFDGLHAICVSLWSSIVKLLIDNSGKGQDTRKRVEKAKEQEAGVFIEISNTKTIFEKDVKVLR